MRGRTSLFVSLDDLESRFEVDYVADGGYKPRFNIAPHQRIEVISSEASDDIDQYTGGYFRPGLMIFITGSSMPVRKPRTRNIR